MGSRVLGIIECDRCLASDEGPDDYWPRDWQKVRIGDGKISLPMFVLCADCYKALRMWLSRTEPLDSPPPYEPTMPDQTQAQGSY